ncbi:HIT domain-containing protein [Thalassiella azotivora]
MSTENPQDTRGGDRPAPTSDPDCLFCRVVDGSVPADVVVATDRVLAFRDVSPQAPLHVLVVPRDHHVDVGALAHADGETLAELVRVGGQVAADEAGGEFRLVFNTGPSAGQSVFHVHGHVLGGRSMTWPPG